MSFAFRRPPLAAFLVAAFFTVSFQPAAHAAGREYVHPMTGHPYPSGITRPFDKPPKNWMPGHRGVDLASDPGQPVFAANSGRVAHVGQIAGVPTISIEHPDGIRTTYQPVHASVSEGDAVEKGARIGIVGHPTAHDNDLHWGALTGKDDYINPLTLLDKPAIRLKPVGAPA